MFLNLSSSQSFGTLHPNDFEPFHTPSFFHNVFEPFCIPKKFFEPFIPTKTLRRVFSTVAYGVLCSLHSFTPATVQFAQFYYGNCAICTVALNFTEHSQLCSLCR